MNKMNAEMWRYYFELMGLLATGKITSRQIIHLAEIELIIDE